MSDPHTPYPPDPPAVTPGHSPGSPSMRRTRFFGLGVLGLLLAGGGLRLAFEHQEARALEARTASATVRHVSTVKVRQGNAQRTVTLPATLRGRSETIIHARSAGYLKAWHKTIGDRVKKGELLATIDAPEQDQELAQAQAARDQVQVRLDLATQTLVRWEKLNALDSIAKQDVDEKRSAVAQARADLAAVNANLRRLEQMKAFRRVVAPFDGVITRRSVEIGDLIAANGKELFAIAQTDPLHITIWVPQAYASEVSAGQEVAISLPENPGHTYQARVAHAAGALDPGSRARQVELVLPNPDGKLLPGSYAQVSLGLTSGLKALLVPTNTLVTGQEGPRVISVSADNRIRFVPVRLGRDLGRDIEILSGLEAGEVLVSSPSDLLTEGETVTPKALPDKGRQGTPGDKPAGPKAAANNTPSSPSAAKS